MHKIPADTRAEVKRLYANNVRQKDICQRMNLLACTVCRIVNESLTFEITRPVLYPADTPVCSRFGCGHHLTVEEQLYGNRCADHQESIKLTHEINKHIYD